MSFASFGGEMPPESWVPPSQRFKIKDVGRGEVKGDDEELPTESRLMEGPDSAKVDSPILRYRKKGPVVTESFEEGLEEEEYAPPTRRSREVSSSQRESVPDTVPEESGERTIRSLGEVQEEEEEESGPKTRRSAQWGDESAA